MRGFWRDMGGIVIFFLIATAIGLAQHKSEKDREGTQLQIDMLAKCIENPRWCR